MNLFTYSMEYILAFKQASSSSLHEIYIVSKYPSIKVHSINWTDKVFMHAQQYFPLHWSLAAEDIESILETCQQLYNLMHKPMSRASTLPIKLLC